MYKGRCAVCGERRNLQRFQERVDGAVGAVLSTGQAPTVIPTECCPVPDYITLREFASKYYGRLWYANPDKVWTGKATYEHCAGVVFITQLYHLYRFSNYTSLERFFSDHDAGELTIVEITNEVLPGFTKASMEVINGSSMPA